MEPKAPQMLDQLELFSLREEPAINEQMIVDENERAKSDELSAKILESVYWESDRDRAFERYHESLDFQTTLKLFKTFGVEKKQSIVEIGGGSGFLSWALTQEGYQDISLLEPNPNWITGTGYLRSRDDAKAIQIENSLDDFYASDRTYDTVVTRNCVHHFPNMTFVAACIRQKLNPGGRWVMIREPYVETAHELYRFLQGHPYSQGYGIYEFGFPAAHFARSLSMAGLRLRAAVPEPYANQTLALYSNDRGSRLNRWMTAAVDQILDKTPTLTRFGFWAEQMLRDCFKMRTAFFTRPQVMVFDREELGEMPASTIWYRPEKAIAKKAA
ncbi:class I SAM-dependent methyltransferase [Roseiconus lacunae]|uniref:class I SAM-dependent methyltransferase n=1 Tax=Roseiconus lacunae TaxID=2605694 RepID=UPI001E47A748|nr:methyltransferase domain-containing protein [Roseiconus lacunae]MCD0459031.1 class I SAM-dependent methyltransferase [Roseiconus lacunae]